MATAIASAVSSLGLSLVTNAMNAKFDQTTRQDWLATQYSNAVAKYPGDMIAIIYPPHDISSMVGLQTEELTCQGKADTYVYTVYAFKSGTLENKGDGGFFNWTYTFVDGKTKKENNNKKITWST